MAHDRWATLRRLQKRCLTCANCFDRKSIAKAGVLRTTRKGDVITDVVIVALLSLSVAGEHFKNVKRFCVFKVSVQVVWKNYLMKCSGSLVQKKIRLINSHAHTLTIDMRYVCVPSVPSTTATVAEKESHSKRGFQSIGDSLLYWAIAAVYIT
jgi:hypothetical protein